MVVRNYYFTATVFYLSLLHLKAATKLSYDNIIGCNKKDYTKMARLGFICIK